MEEARQYSESQKTLVNAIKITKRRCWKQLCQEVERDPWGRPYKIVMKKLGCRRPIIGAEKPERLDVIVAKLFSRKTQMTEPIGTTEIGQNRTSSEKQHPEVTKPELLEEVRKLPCGKASGPDGVVNEFLKAVIQLDPIAAADMFNTCLKENYYPADWKVANLVLIHKPERPTEDSSSYRPLCIMNTTRKLFERILTRRLQDYLENARILCDNQYGFRKHRSTTDAIKILISIIENGNKRKSVVGMLTLDVCNAFNSAPWESIISVLEEANVPEYIQNIVGAYLTDRKVHFKVGGETKELTVTAGVPQGSVIVPCLWNMMCNGLLKQRLPEGVEIIAFSDDVAVVATQKHKNFLEEKLEEAFNTVSQWMRRIGLILAEHKTEAIVFTTRYTQKTINVRYGNTMVCSENKIKYLGLMLDPKLIFKEHANHTTKKTADITKKLGYILPNIGGAGQRRRMLLSCVVTSRLLYGFQC